MQEVIQFAALGLGAGAVYGLLAQGVVLVYRASGVVNFAQAAMAMIGAFIFYEINVEQGVAYLPAMILAALLTAALSALVYLLVQRPLRHASPLARVVATLGVLTVAQAVALLRYADHLYSIESPFPTDATTIFGIIIPKDRLWILGIAVAISALLWAIGRYTRFGLATAAVAENEQSAAALGWSPTRIAGVNWALGGALAAVAGILIVPLISLTVSSLNNLLVPTLAVALFAGFRSVPLALLGSLGLGIAQSLSTRYVDLQGFGEALPLIVIVAVLVLRGQSLPLRGQLLDRLPKIGGGHFRLQVVLPLAAIAIVLVQVVPQEWQAAIGISAIVAVMLLSLVVVTGYAGQLSLAQYTLGGAGAFIAGKLVVLGWPFELAALLGIGGAALAGLVIALPAVRARGITLAIVTLALGYAVTVIVFNRPEWTGGGGGLIVGEQSFFGIDLNATVSPAGQASIAIGAFTLCAFLVGNVRRSRAGRRLIAVRTNERAAASLGVNVRAAKLYAFSLSAAIAAVGGILLAFKGQAILFSQTFAPMESITAVTLAVLGGIGYVLGPLFGSTLAVGGFPGGLIANHVGNGGNWLLLIGGVVLLLILITQPNGLAFANIKMAKDLVGLIRRRRPEPKQVSAPARPERVEKRTGSCLSLREVSVRFGGVVALDSADLEVRSGEVVGLIGPNGAGKTTLIDAVTGFVRPAEGTVELDGVELHKRLAYQRARAGVTRSFQSLELFDDVTVLDNLRAASDSRDLGAYVSNAFYPAEQELSSAAIEAIYDFELEDDLHRRPEELSYGKRRLVAIARAVATEAKVLLLDEPAAGLSDHETAELGLLIRRLADNWGLGILLVEHDMSVVMSTCDRIAVLNFGRKIAEGSPAEVQKDPDVIAAYLGSETSEEEHGPPPAVREEVG